MERRGLQFVPMMVDDRDLKRLGVQPVRDLQPFINRMKIRVSLMSDTDQKDFSALFIEAADAAADRCRRGALLFPLYELRCAFSEGRYRVCRM